MASVLVERRRILLLVSTRTEKYDLINLTLPEAYRISTWAIGFALFTIQNIRFGRF